MDRSRLCLVALLPVLTLAWGCGNGGGSPDADSLISDTSDSGMIDVYDGQRILKAGMGPASSRKPDCDHYTEWGFEGEPVLGENCIEWGLKTWGGRAGAISDVIAVVDVKNSILGYYDGHAERNVCSLYTGVGYETLEIPNYWIPLEFNVIDVWKGDQVPLSGAVVFGHCERRSAPLCDIAGAEWYIQPGLNLVLMLHGCCADQFRDDWLQLIQIYPVENGFVYDWDGDAIPLQDVRMYMIDQAWDSVSPVDGSCPLPNTVDAVGPNDTVDGDIDAVVVDEVVG